MPFVSTPNLTIEYKTAGDGPTPVVFIHGNFGTWRWWQPVLNRLPRGFRAFAPLTRGFGRSRAKQGGYDMPQLASDLDTFVREVGLDSFHLVAHSLGGAIAIQYALNHTDKVRSLMLVSPVPAGGLSAMSEGDSRPAPMLRCLESDLLSSLALRPLLQTAQWVGTDRVMIRQALKEMMPTANLNEESLQSLLDDASQLSPEAVTALFESLRNWDVRSSLKDLTAPTTILWGGMDTMIPKSTVEETSERIPTGQLVVWPDVGHAPQLEKPEAFADLLAEFVSRRSIPTYLRYWYYRLRVLALAWLYSKLPPNPVKALGS